MAELTRDDYLALRNVRYGNANPEKIDNRLWLEATQRYLSPDRLRASYDDPAPQIVEADASRRLMQPIAADREVEPRPVWAFQRTGQTETRLPDGRVVRIGGRYWQSGSIDTCIYNDILVEHPEGRIEIFGYPRDIFPPRHGHSATLAGREIIIIGGAGYGDLDAGDVISVFRLNTETFAITPLASSGEQPGPISQHGAAFDGDRLIAIIGGEQGRSGAGVRQSSPLIYEFDLHAARWRKLAHDERAFFGASMADYRAQRQARYGRQNPERVHAPVWEQAIRDDLSAWQVRMLWGDRRYGRGNPGNSGFRESDGGPVWSWSRFGRTETALPDGRTIFVAGEHEDSYDPDFCIYNDVVIAHDDGQIEIYAYPEDIFPPTDFHSATLVGDDLILVGSLGYIDKRLPGETQVYRLNTGTYRITPIKTGGNAPGWIFHHTAEMTPEGEILIVGGQIEKAGQERRIHTANDQMFALSTAQWTWRLVPHGDLAVFPVSIEDYRRARNPRFGQSNPERVTAAFWLAMIANNWTPQRARLHFGDPGKSMPSYDSPEYDTKRIYDPGPIDTVVWSPIREDAAELKLDNGTHLTIGGTLRDFGEAWGDNWVYNDIIVRRVDGTNDVYAYPAGLFPPMVGLSTFETNGRALIFGRPAKGYPHAFRPLAFSLDLATFEVAFLGVGPETRPVTLTEFPQRDAEQVRFPIMKQSAGDPDRFMIFDIRTKRWLSP